MLALMAISMVVGLVLVGIGLGLLLGASCLRLAALWLKLGSISFPRALNAVAVSGVTIAVFNIMVSWPYYAAMIAESDHQRALIHGFGRELPENSIWASFLRASFSPTFCLMSATMGVLLSAVIYRRMVLDNPGQKRIRFGDAVALAALQNALALVTCAFASGVAYWIISWMLKR